MIEPLSEKDTEQAENVLRKGLEEENPPGAFPKETVPMTLDENNTFVKKVDEKIEGIVVYAPDGGSPTRYKIEFICSCAHRKGTGKELLRHLAEHLKELGVGEIITIVSTIDPRACAFYERCGFAEYGTEEKEYERGTFTLKKIRATPGGILEALSK